MIYKVLLQKSLEERYALVEADSIADAERISGGIVVFLVDSRPTGQD